MAGGFSMDRGMALRGWPGRGCRLGSVTVRRAPGKARGRRPLVPVADRFAARPGSAAEVHSGPADRLTRQASR